MSRQTHLDQERLVALRLQRGLAVRQLARDCGIEIAVLNRLETGDNPSLSTISVAALTRLADRLNVPIDALFTTTTTAVESYPADTDPEQPDTAADVRRLGALLNALGQDTAVVAIADALGWTSRRVHHAAAALDELLTPTGTTIFKNNGLISIRPADDTHSDAELAVKRHPRAKPSQRLVTPARARILRRAQTTAVSQHSLSGNDRVNIATLLKAGLLEESDQRRLVPTQDVLDSLDPPHQVAHQEAGHHV